MDDSLNYLFFRLNELKTSFLHNSIDFWNKIPFNIKSIQNIIHHSKSARHSYFDSFNYIGFRQN